MLTWWMILLLLIYILICFLLMAAILLQSGKGGGLSSLAGGSSGLTDAIGATGAEKTMNRITTAVAVGFMLMAILLSVLGRYAGSSQNGSEIFSGETAVPAVQEMPIPATEAEDALPAPVIPEEVPDLPVVPAE